MGSPFAPSQSCRHLLALFVLSLVKAARRALLSAKGYQVERALAVTDQWMEDAAERAAV